MSVMTKNGIADVIEMWHLNFVEEDAIFEFAGVPHHESLPELRAQILGITSLRFARVSDPPWCRALPNRARKFARAVRHFVSNFFPALRSHARLRVALLPVELRFRPQLRDREQC